MQVDIIPAFTGKTADYTTSSSPKVYVGNYSKVAILLRAASISAGNGIFQFYGGLGDAVDSDPTMTALATVIDNIANATANGFTRVATKTLSANGDALMWLSPETPVSHLQIALDMTTDGTYSAWIIGFND